MRRLPALLALIGTSLLAREYGPAVGSKLPAFRLSDQNGKMQSLPGVLGPKGALIVFYRSADW